MISGVLLSLAIPSIDNLLNRTRLEIYARGLVHDLKFAQFEAIKHQQTVLLCPTHNFKECSNTKTSGYLIGFKQANNLMTPLRVKRLKDVNLNVNTALDGKVIAFNDVGICQGQGNIRLTLATFSKNLVIIHSGRVRSDPIELI